MGELREINLEAGMPLVADALRRLTFEVHHSKALGYAALKLIHGYGSSGKGGKIRVAARDRLEFLMQKREIRGYICGEDFSIFNDDTRQAFPALRRAAQRPRPGAAQQWCHLVIL